MHELFLLLGGSDSAHKAAARQFIDGHGTILVKMSKAYDPQTAARILVQTGAFRLPRAGRSAGRIDKKHLRADAADLRYIKKEARDIQGAVKRMSARDRVAAKSKGKKPGCSCKH